MRYFIFLIFIICAEKAITQEAYQFSVLFPNTYYFQPDIGFKNLNAKPLEGLTFEQSTKFRIRMIYGLQKEFDENEIYLNWGVVENYVSAVLDSIYPKKFRPNRFLEVYVGRDPAINAHATDNGFLFVNIGLLASLRTEAALAATLAHEVGHALNFHSYNQYADVLLFEKNNPNKSLDFSLVSSTFSRNYEQIADTFAFSKMLKSGYNLKAILNKFDIFERETIRSIHKTVPVYTAASNTRIRNFLKDYSSHPMNKERIETAMKMQKKSGTPGKDYRVDSVLFNKIRAVANEECKRILFEKADYKKCINRCFVDYLYNERKMRNLYFLVESLRRLLYSSPDLSEKGFLADEYSDKEFIYWNKSILQKPELLFLDSIQQKELQNHPLFTVEPKPFRSYDEAFVFFCDQAKAVGLNEANFSEALYFYAKKNEVKFHTALNAYLAGNSKMNEEFALSLQTNNKPILSANKMLFVVDNSGKYAEDDTYFDMNYFQSINKRKANVLMAPLLAPDTDKIKLVFLNDLAGKKPRDLYDLQKIEVALQTLFNKSCKDMYKRRGVFAKPNLSDRDVINNKFNRNIFIFQPELYKWFLERDYGSLCVTNISYDFKKPLDTIEKISDYTAYYLNFSDVRPFIKTGMRSSFNRKQAEEEIAKELIDFLYAKD